MACFCSCWQNVYHRHPELHHDRRHFESIFLTSRQVRDFYSEFCQVDHSDNFASCEELFSFFDVNHSMFSKRATRGISESGSSTREISFLQFVLSVWNYCTADVDTMTDLCFRMYLPQSLEYEDEIMGSDMKEMLKDLYGDNYLLQYPKLSKVQNKLVSLHDVPINLEQFQEFCQSHDLLAPAFQTQSRLRTILFGQKFWTQATKKRKRLEFIFAFKNDFKLEYESLEKYFDLPRKPASELPATSEQNHGRGNVVLTAKVQEAKAQAKRAGGQQDERKDPDECGGSRDHPSLRTRRRSKDKDLGVVDRTTKLKFQKNMGPTEHDLSQLKKDVLSISSGKSWRASTSYTDEREGGGSGAGSSKRRIKNSSSRRRHSFCAENARVAPVIEGNENNSPVAVAREAHTEKSKNGVARRKNRRLTF